MVFAVNLRCLGLAALTMLITSPGSAYDDYTHVPTAIEECAAAADASLKIDLHTNPFYLRGDFDGDGKADYAAHVYKGGQAEDAIRHGLLICHGAGTRRLTGDGLGPDLEGVEPDYLAAPNWVVARKGDPDTQAIEPAGEVILMLWEDGVAAIFLQDGKYRWRWAWTPDMTSPATEPDGSPNQ